MRGDEIVNPNPQRVAALKLIRRSLGDARGDLGQRRGREEERGVIGFDPLAQIVAFGDARAVSINQVAM